MAQTPSQMLALGTPAPAFTLPDADGVLHSLAYAEGRPATLVMFICNHCPFVIHVADELARLGRDCEAKDVAVDGKDLRGAIDALLAGGPVSDKQVPSIGCNIKWIAGNEPPWF